MRIEEQLSAAIFGDRGTVAADRLCLACVDLLGVDAAAISLVFDGASTATLGVSSSSARMYDEVQFIVGEGPCLESVSSRQPVFAPDLADVTESRWPAYVPAMLAHRIRSVHAMPVVLAGEYVGSLDLFSVRPGQLRGRQVAGALAAATLAEMPLLDLIADDLRASFADPDSDSWSELHQLTRVEVSQATGMLVQQLDVEPAEALVRLRAHAYANNRTATEVARDILDGALHLDVD